MKPELPIPQEISQGLTVNRLILLMLLLKLNGCSPQSKDDFPIFKSGQGVEVHLTNGDRVEGSVMQKNSDYLLLGWGRVEPEWYIPLKSIVYIKFKQVYHDPRDSRYHYRDWTYPPAKGQ